MSGDMPVWLFAVLLAVGCALSFAGGYAWCSVGRRWLLRREVRRIERRLAERGAARSGGTLDATRFTG